jgi:alpha-ribazole phosphatase
MRVYLIRHGMTAGNREKRYIGRTDEPLCSEGIAALQVLTPPPCDHLIVSPMRRCTETAAILYPDQKPVLCSLLRECDFGDFEGKNHIDMDGDPVYQAWIDSGGMGDFPHGESPAAFKARCVAGFRMLMAGMDGTAAFVVHGGTIMAICEALHGGEFYSYHLLNGGIFRADWDGERLTELERL